jgi:uncharacterized protein (DUF427 family)
MMQTYEARNGEHIGFKLSPKWIRVMFGGEFIADSKRAYLLLPGGPPHYYFPKEDVRMDLLQPTDYTRHSPLLGTASYWRVKVGDKTAENAVWSYPEPVSDELDLSGYVAFDWGKMDEWFEEDEEVLVHPHNPYERIDILHSTRHVVVLVGGETVAESHNPALLFETGLPIRYYLPKLDVRVDLLLPSDKATGCAYKGKAQYHSVKVGDKIIPDIAWHYAYPTLEASKIAGMVCFFNERVDALYVDGVEQPKPKTAWS